MSNHIIKKRVKTVWQGKVGVREKYINQAKAEKKDLLIAHDGKEMMITFDEIDDRIIAKSDEKFQDYFSRRPAEYLYYFQWKPDPPLQPSLL